MSTDARPPRAGGAPPAVAEPGTALLRIGDAERSAAVARLGEHHIDGRLDTAEFDERAAAAFAARTAEDLEVLFADLPAPEPPPAPPRRVPPVALLVVAGMLAAVAGMWTIWLLTGGGHPWPLYPMMGLVPMLMGATCGARRT